MKRTLVAIAVAAFAATSANAATVYEKDGTKLDINGSVRVMLNKITDQRTDLQNDGSRFKFKFSQQLGEGFSGLGYLEFRPEGDDFGDGFVTKRVYAGFAQDNVGTLTFGKRLTAGDNFKLADPTEQGWSSVDGAEFVYPVTYTENNVDYIKLDDKKEVKNTKSGLVTGANKVIDFTSARWNGFGFQTSYVFSDNAKKGSFNDRTWQLLASYENDFDGLGLAANALYSHTKVMEDVNHKVWGLATAVNYAGFGFAVDYTDSKLEDLKAKTIELAATYQVSDPLDVYVTYTHSKGDKLEAVKALNGDYTVKGESYKYDIDLTEDVKTKAISVGAHYALAKNVKTYVEYSTKKVDKADRENAYYAGLRVYF